MSCLKHVFVFFDFVPLIRYHPYLSFDLTLSSHFLLEIGSSLQCRDITNGNGTLTDSVVSAPKAGDDELKNLDNGEILLPKQCSGSRCGCHHYLKAINTIGSVSCPALVFLG